MREEAARNGKKRARFTSFCPIFEVLTIKQKERSERFITLTCSFNGANGRTRTGDLRITNALLYQLSQGSLSHKTKNILQ